MGGNEEELWDDREPWLPSDLHNSRHFEGRMMMMMMMMMATMTMVT
jgi:hypothetical protein